MVGIGGVGMAALAEVLVRRGHRVSGSDLRRTSLVEHLERLGARVYLGHRPEQVGRAQLVVHSAAVPLSNPELQEARRRGTPVISRGELLARLLEGARAITVAGAHGKTTTTALLGEILIRAGMDPTVLVGGRPLDWPGNARAGGPLAVAEVDESDGSFLLVHRPYLSLITNLDREHLWSYGGSLRRLQEAFRHFMERSERVVACADDPALRCLIPPGALTYGLREGVLRATDLEADARGLGFRLWQDGRPRRLWVRALGVHNALNALGAVAAARWLGASWEAVEEALEGFPGVARRLEVKFEGHGLVVVDDYAHHPAEIRAALQALRSAWGGRTVAVFQPHRYTRTRDLLQEFATALRLADVLLVLPIYGAGERPLSGVDERLREAVGGTPVADHQEAVQCLRRMVRPGDVVVTLGAGDVWKVAEELCRYLGC